MFGITDPLNVHTFARSAITLRRKKQTQARLGYVLLLAPLRSSLSAVRRPFQFVFFVRIVVISCLLFYVFASRWNLLGCNKFFFTAVDDFFFHPTESEILHEILFVSGLDVRHFTRRALRHRIALLSRLIFVNPSRDRVYCVALSEFIIN